MPAGTFFERAINNTIIQGLVGVGPSFYLLAFKQQKNVGGSSWAGISRRLWTIDRPSAFASKGTPSCLCLRENVNNGPSK